ncbi:general transcription factor IIH subunit 4, partial [Pyrgilauda ruficollis]|uniref:general transcription factor IIH subunit 4 n=1 Tax=Pyrgilauda ruficollis TaxID=221976 RepID=UPI001B8860FD
EQQQSQEVLLELRLWHPHTLPGGLPGVALHPNFRQNLRVALLGGGKAWSDDTAPLGPDRHARDVPALDKYAEERWEVVLHFMVGSPSAAVSQDLAQLLVQAGLMKSEGGEPPCITSAGFRTLGTALSSYSELQVALIALFSELLYRFPNLVVAQVTRDSVQAAIANGITAEQIIHFLRTRAHPVMAQQSPVLPPTITDQIRLWELERDRLRFSEGVLYNQFLSQVDFEVLRDHARALGVLVFENPARRLMVVTPAGHPDVKRF